VLRSEIKEPLAKIGKTGGETRRCAGTQLCKSGIDRISTICDALHQGRLGVIARLFFPHLCTWHAPDRTSLFEKLTENRGNAGFLQEALIILNWGGDATSLI